MRLVPILMAEDDLEDQMLSKIALSESKLQNPFMCVENGQELMDYLHRKPPFQDTQKYPLPGLIILDLNMPVKDGMTTLRELKSDDNFKHIPVVILTTSSEDEEIIKSYNEGANSFITKPVRLDKLIEIMKQLGKYWFSIVEAPHDE